MTPHDLLTAAAGALVPLLAFGVRWLWRGGEIRVRCERCGDRVRVRATVCGPCREEDAAGA